MITTFDHVIVLARDIEECARSFGAAGFAVTTREDEGGHIAEHRLVCFPDGSYLELYAFDRDNPDARSHRWFRYDELGEGFCDYSVTTTDLQGVVDAAEAAGIPSSGFAEGGKKRLDGEEWILRMTALGVGVAGPELPFVLEDVTPRAVRVSGTAPHANGATGISSVTIATADPASAHVGLAMLTGCSDPVRSERADGAVTSYRFGAREIRLLVPAAGTDAARRLAEAGPVVYEIEVAGAEAGLLDPASVHAARIVLSGTTL
ncbi:VOC family protein [Nocardioides marmoriginsengisoli]|uniref:VOC family protein n=1 Tax=Nocardioides marmoriginsengisoli TaxID=661483 RepID=UPI0011CD52C8|nr:VOC family protein [Nocardioides marmoriginsengisoli]